MWYAVFTFRHHTLLIICCKGFPFYDLLIESVYIKNK
jgi:hypothetical protein